MTPSNEAVQHHLDNLMTVLGADSTVTEDYQDRGEQMFVALVELSRTYINEWAARSGEGAISDFVVTYDDMEDPSRATDPHAVHLSLLPLLFDSLACNVAYPEWGDVSGADVELTYSEGTHWGTVNWRQLAKAVLSMAASGDMPDSYWLSDSRIEAACNALGWTPEDARTWAQGGGEWDE